ncbi:MAG: SDR family oxidoreductase [Actinomycetales bacterium]|nr:SDR family oxidoreductase [Actinomycetales bacterium]
MTSALITGASRGIGRGVALELARLGYGLTVTARDPGVLEALAEELRSSGAPTVVPVAADLADRDALTAVVERHAEAFGSMDALVLSGGTGTAGPLETLPASRVDRTITVNLTSAIHLVQAALPWLRAAAASGPTASARVILLASITGAYAEAGLAAYGASKAALLSLAETLNAEESGGGVMATAVAPAYVDTDMSEWTKETIPAETMLRVEDIVSIVRMLLGLGRTASITRIVVSRSGASAYGA